MHTGEQRMERGGVRPRRKRILSLVLAMALALGVPLVRAQEGAVPLDIPSRPLGEALEELTRQAGLPISFTRELVAGKQAPTVRGTMPPRRALDALLQGSGLEAAQSGSTVTLQRAAAVARGEQQLPEVKVRGESERESAWGPVQGYAAQRSATGTKTDTPLIETPQSISVITRDRLERLNPSSFSEAVRYTAGVQGEPFGLEPRFTDLRIRGFDVTDTGLFVDGLKLPSDGSRLVTFKLEPYGAERIEVLKGPASVLYGQGNPGGLVNFVSKQPTLIPSREVGLEVGSFDRLQGKFDLSGPIDRDGVLAYRMTGLVRNSDTQVDFIRDDHTFLAPAFAWRPSKDTTLTVLTHFLQDRTQPSQSYPAQGTLFSSPNGDMPTSRFVGEPGVEKYDRDEYAIGYLLEHRARDALTFRQNARYQHTDLEIFNVFNNGFNPADVRQREILRGAFHSTGKLESIALDNQAQWNVSTGPVSHTLLAGLDYQRAALRVMFGLGGAPSLDVFDPVYGAPVTDPARTVRNDADLDQVGLYVQDQIKLNRWILSLGGRQDWAGTKINGLEQGDDAFTGRAGLMYLFDTGVAPYVSYAESFLPALGGIGTQFEPETGKQYELGIKYQPPGQDGILTLALFDLTRQNVLQTSPPPTFVTVQTGEVQSRGVELEWVGQLTSALSLIASYTYRNVKIRESVIPSQVGTQLGQTPKQLGSAWLDYSLRGRWNIGAGVRYLGSAFTDLLTDTGPFNTQKVPDATLVDAGIRYDWKSFRFALDLKNIFDKEYVAACFERGGLQCTFGDRRSVVGNITYRF